MHFVLKTGNHPAPVSIKSTVELALSLDTDAVFDCPIKLKKAASMCEFAKCRSGSERSLYGEIWWRRELWGAFVTRWPYLTVWWKDSGRHATLTWSARRKAAVASKLHRKSPCWLLVAGQILCVGLWTHIVNGHRSRSCNSSWTVMLFLSRTKWQIEQFVHLGLCMQIIQPTFVPSSKDMCAWRKLSGRHDIRSRNIRTPYLKDSLNW